MTTTLAATVAVATGSVLLMPVNRAIRADFCYIVGMLRHRGRLVWATLAAPVTRRTGM